MLGQFSQVHSGFLQYVTAKYGLQERVLDRGFGLYSAPLLWLASSETHYLHVGAFLPLFDVSHFLSNPFNVSFVSV